MEVLFVWTGQAQPPHLCLAVPHSLSHTQIDPLQAGLVDPLGRIMSQLIGGGGAAKVNIDKVVDDLNELSEQYPFNVSWQCSTCVQYMIVQDMYSVYACAVHTSSK